MSLNDRKIVSIIFKECIQIDERCEGYRKEIFEVISDIIDYERQHRVQGTNIQQKINDKCNAVAKFLAEKRGHDVTAEE